MSIIESRDAVPELHHVEWGLEADARSLGIAEHAVRAAVHAAQAVVDRVDAHKGIASEEAAFESAVAAAVGAEQAVDRIHGDAGFRDPEFRDVHDEDRTAAHLAEFWNALEQDVRFLEGKADQDGDWTKALVSLTERSLWPGGMPVWAGRQWAVGAMIVARLPLLDASSRPSTCQRISRHCYGRVLSLTEKAPAFVYGERVALSRRISAIAWLNFRAILARASKAAAICASLFSRVSPRAVSSSRTNSLISLPKLV